MPAPFHRVLCRVFLCIPLAAAGVCAQPSPGPQQGGPGPAGARGVEIVERATYPELHVDGKPFFVHSAAFFYYRIPRDLWEASLDRHAALGINAIHLPIPWSWHEPREGELDFEGRTNPRRDLRGLLRLVAEKGFKLIAQPGPVAGTDWRHAGYPEWLLERPEYAMPAAARRAGRYPPLAELGTRDPEAAAQGWLDNATHMAATRKWLAAVARELEPYSPRRSLTIQVLEERGERKKPEKISGPLLFVLLEDPASAAGLASPGPAWRRYLAELRGTLESSGLAGSLFLHAGAFPASDGAPGATFAAGSWFLRPDPEAPTAARTERILAAQDFAGLEQAVEHLKTQPGFPPLVMGFQAGWHAPADDARAAESAPANTLLASRLLVAHGALGLNYFPAQDTFTPAGYTAAGAGRHYRWDAPLDLGGNEKARARAVTRNAVIFDTMRELLPASHTRADFGVVVPLSAAGAEAPRLQHRALQLGRVAFLAGMALEWLDPERQPVEHLLRHPLVLLPALEGVALSEKAQGALVEYVKRGGVLAVVPPRPAGALLDELWPAPGTEKKNTEGTEKHRERREEQAEWPSREMGGGRVIALPGDLSSWVELQESFAETRLRGEAIGAVALLEKLLAAASTRALVKRAVNGPATGELAITQLVSNQGSEALGGRSRGQGILSVTNLSYDEAGEEMIEVLSPRTGARAAGGGYIALPVHVPAREALLLPLHFPLCSAAGPPAPCRDEVVAAGAELLRAERNGRTLELTLYAPARATVILHLERQPGRVMLEEFRPEAEWFAEANELRVRVPRGAWPHFTRLLRIHLPYTPHVPEPPEEKLRGRRDFDFSVADAVRLPVGDDASLPTHPPLVVLEHDRSGRMLVEGTNHDELGRDLRVAVEGPVRGSDSIGLSGLETRQMPVELKAGRSPENAGDGAASSDGLLHGELEVRSGKDRRRSPIAFVAVPKEGVAAYRFDFDRDGAEEWVLENSGLRLMVSPADGGRALALVDKESGSNLLSAVGGLLDAVGHPGGAAGGVVAGIISPFAAEWAGEPTATVLRLRADPQEEVPPGMETEKTVRLAAPDTAEVEYTVRMPAGPHGAAFAVANSFPASSGARGTQFCWSASSAAEKHAAGGEPQAAEPQCEPFTPGGTSLRLPEDVRRVELRTPGRTGVALEWNAGRMVIESKPFSALLRLEFAEVAPGTAGIYKVKYVVRPPK